MKTEARVYKYSAVTEAFGVVGPGNTQGIRKLALDAWVALWDCYTHDIAGYT